MDNAISFEELDAIAGEVLPERTVMGIVATPFNALSAGPGPDGGAGAGAASSSSAASGGGVFAPAPSDHGTTILSSCQSIDRQGTPGLFGSLGLGSEQPTNSLTCTPAAISSH
ncbi:hypothetical protein LE181_03500 [Streptomyces sp. SCA3-4]|uniref:hypothetical protein n=1 Tax=Streptomyces sichuanensis TaxID=2871810 RepID=UPI001CE2D3E9|nr:hypothetical protein [Streptomyces sichuanensis]MCA6091235.1 hypothetical protein [Streptomyces sichuanensis]